MRNSQRHTYGCSRRRACISESYDEGLELGAIAAEQVAAWLAADEQIAQFTIEQVESMFRDVATSIRKLKRKNTAPKLASGVQKKH